MAKKVLPKEMNDHQLLRYSRHILLSEVGIEGQQRLLDAHALLIGAGGLGSPIALYLAASGVGHITVVDDDTVELTNLQRQIAHSTQRIGSHKVHSIATSMQALNPGIRVTALVQCANPDTLPALVASADVVIDSCDNFTTRQAVNHACVAHAKPLVSGAAMGFDGQVSVFDSRTPDAACYACLFPPEPAPQEARCASMGVWAPLVGIIGSVVASEALKLLAGVGESLQGRLQMLDARSMRWSEMQLGRNPQCQICGPKANGVRHF
jgi:molybdopterin-synthase adenylyltransferase